MENLKKRASLKLPARAGIWSVLSGLVARGVGVVGTPIFTRLLTPAEYGLYPLYTTWLSLFTALFSTALTGSVIYRGLQKFKDCKERFTSAASGLGLSVALMLFIIGIPLSPLLEGLTGLGSGILMIMIAEIALSTVISVRSSALRYEYSYKRLALINLISAIGAPSISVLIVIATPYHAEARIIGSMMTSVAVAIPILAGMRSGARLFDKEIWGYLIRACLPILPHCIASSLILRISETVIGRTHGEAALAKYSVGLSVGLALTFLSNALGGASSPWILRKIAGGEQERVKEMLTLMHAALISASALILCLAPEILSVITPPEYADALPTVYPLTLTVPLMLLSNSIIAAEAYYERRAAASLPTVLTALLSGLAALLILPRVDYRFSALFTLGAYLLLLSLSHLTYRKISGNSILDIRKCILLFAFGGIYAILAFALREVLISRIILVTPILPLVILLGRKVYKRIKE